MKAIISKHNKAIMSKHTDTENTNMGNCRRANQKYLTNSMVYQATVTSNKNDSKETYIGFTKNQLKKRFNNYKASFKNRDKRTSTKLSNYLWKLKDDGHNYNIIRSRITKAKAYNPITNNSNLCTAEKYYIMSHPYESSLHKRRELVTACRHLHKHLLCSCAGPCRNRLVVIYHICYLLILRLTTGVVIPGKRDLCAFFGYVFMCSYLLCVYICVNGCKNFFLKKMLAKFFEAKKKTCSASDREYPSLRLFGRYLQIIIVTITFSTLQIYICIFSITCGIVGQSIQEVNFLITKALMTYISCS